MTKIAINRSFGGFGLSDEANHALAARKGVTLYEIDRYFDMKSFATVPKEEYQRLEQESRVQRNYDLVNSVHWNSQEWGRDDPDLVAVIQELGEEANGPFAKLTVVDIPNDVDWEICEYDGKEWVAEKHRTWR